MVSIADEIQAVAENADKCINYPIGDKLAEFIRQQDASGETNFVLSGVLIHAGARIYGRKVDYLEQEIHGISKNFAAVDMSDDKVPEKEVKKIRTKKFLIKDRVNLAKAAFEEKPIQVLTKTDINKTLAVPSKINRLQRMKEFFSKNKTRTGKLVIPKTLLFTNDYVVSNFGATQIYDFDDNKEVVGSRRDFTSFSYFINNCTGELQSDIDTSATTQRLDDFLISNRENISENISTPLNRAESPEIYVTAPNSPARPDSPDLPTFINPINGIVKPLPLHPGMDLSQLSINLDEGIVLEDADRANLLLPIKPFVSLIDIRVKSPNLFPDGLQVNDDIDVGAFDKSVLSVQHELAKNISEFELPAKLRDEAEEAKFKNIFLIPIKKLKHKCLFDLPNDEYGELKKRRRDQFKAMGPDLTLRQMRPFKPLDMLKTYSVDEDNAPFLGFTKEQQEAPMTSFSFPRSHQQPPDLLRKFSNDSGSGDAINATNSIHTESISEKPTSSATINETSINAIGNDSVNTTDPKASDSETENLTINTSGGDSCYHSCVSGDSTKTDLSSFFKDIESRNNTLYESEATNASPEESEERVLQMQQSAVNIAKWKEYLKPILADSEARSKIDMHQYGLELINKIGNINDSVSFADITEAGKTPAYFLTMLQLTNNRNVALNYGERSMTEPVDVRNIKITLKSKSLHREKFDEMGQQFVLEEEKKTNLKRKAVQTSTPTKPAKRRTLQAEESAINFNSPNISQSMDEGMEQDDIILSQASSGYCSQSSVLSDC